MSRIPGFVQIGNTIDVHPKCVVTVERVVIKDPSGGGSTCYLRIGMSNGRRVEILANSYDELLTLHGDLAKAMGGED